jgi:hypothetical protein
VGHAAAIPRCIKGSREFQAIAPSKHRSNMQHANEGRGYHLIIYGFRRINRITNENKKN